MILPAGTYIANVTHLTGIIASPAYGPVIEQAIVTTGNYELYTWVPRGTTIGTRCIIDVINPPDTEHAIVKEIKS